MRANSHPHEVSLEDLVNGDHERCANPRCRSFFPFVEGKLNRVRGIRGKFNPLAMP